MANKTTAGGSYKGGAGAQEENLFRRSNYCQALEDQDGVVGHSPHKVGRKTSLFDLF